MVLGWVARQHGEYEQAKRLTSEVLSLSSGLDDKYHEALALLNLGAVRRDQGDYEEATALHKKALAITHAAPETSGTTLAALTLSHLGMDYLRRGDYARASGYYAQSLSMCKETGDRWIPVLCLAGLGDIACIEQRYTRAARLFGAGNQLGETLGYRFNPGDRECHDHYSASTRARLGESAFAAAWTEGWAMTLEQAIEYALAVETH
jgi:tetratricopeptide (TPR) repeat protein